MDTVINTKKCILIVLTNILIIVLAVMFIIIPNYQLLESARFMANLYEAKYNASRRMEVEYENSIYVISQTPTIINYNQFAFVIAEISSLVRLNNLQQLNFVANPPIVHEVLNGNNIKEIQVRAEYTGSKANIESFLNALYMVEIYSLEINVGAETRLGLGLSIFTNY